MAADGALTIPEIQYTASPDGASSYNGQVVDCVGGVVVLKVAGSRPRLVLQDPNALDGWAGIQVKGWASNAFADVNEGDWVRIERTFVEENRGTTFLQYWDDNPDDSLPVLTVVSRGHILPRPIVVDVNEIKAPEYLPLDDAWVVADHSAERFESTLLQIRSVDMVAQGLGKAQDNYELQSFAEPNDPNARCWASDYMNRDRVKPALYLPGIEVGRRLRGVTGMLEQYTNLGEGYDYYQLLTLSEASAVGLCPADLDQDGDIDLWDYRSFTEQLLTASAPSTADLNGDGIVDLTDRDLFDAAWQQADVNGDGIVDGDDLD
ncbi:MAG: hypothetical protein A2Y76_04345 [Planctomycetes bacterium RBG_13_60_9]|nr:MAG: hypothetical protein A2Y76_04345 [Planctomycetes bacterium RBG_13_60_9]